LALFIAFKQFVKLANGNYGFSFAEKRAQNQD